MSYVDLIKFKRFGGINFLRSRAYWAIYVWLSEERKSNKSGSAMFVSCERHFSACLFFKDFTIL